MGTVHIYFAFTNKYTYMFCFLFTNRLNCKVHRQIFCSCKLFLDGINRDKSLNSTIRFLSEFERNSVWLPIHLWQQNTFQTDFLRVQTWHYWQNEWREFGAELPLWLTNGRAPVLESFLQTSIKDPPKRKMQMYGVIYI